MQTTRRSSWSITTSTPERPNLKRNNSEPLVPFPAVIFKPRMNGEIARLTNPNGSWSPLGVLLKPVPIQVIILKMLTRNDIMNLISTDASSRRILQEVLNSYPGTHPREYQFFAPNPPTGLCNTFEFPTPDGRPLNWKMYTGWWAWDFPGYVKARQHRTGRLVLRSKELLHIKMLPGNLSVFVLASGDKHGISSEDSTITNIEKTFTNYDTGSYNYSEQEWFHCRRAKCDNKSLDKAPCCECEGSNRDIIEHNANLYYNRGWQWQIVCGFCHLKATEQYPHGFKSCSCAEDLSEQTCTPCFDRVFGVWRKRCEIRKQNWPKTTKDYVCPCGREVDLFEEASCFQAQYETSPTHSKHRIYAPSRNERTRFCLVCDGIHVPWTAERDVWPQFRSSQGYYHRRWNPHSFRPERDKARLLFKKIMGLPGDKKVDIFGLKKDASIVRNVANSIDHPIRSGSDGEEAEKTLKLYKYLNY